MTNSNRSQSGQLADTIPLKTKLAFGLGATGEQVCLRSFALFALMYYNQVLDMPASLAGIALTIALLFDAVSDPLIGSISDRFKSKKWGRRHPFLFAAPIPVSVSYYFIFNPPELNAAGLFVWFLVFSVLLRTFMTLFFVPHLAMGAELSKYYTERSKIMSYNYVFGYIGAAGVYWVAMSTFFASTPELPNGMLNEQGYKNMGILCGAFALVSLYLSAWFTRDRIPHLSQPRDTAAKYSFRAFGQDLKQAISNRNYLFLLLGFFCLSVMLGARDGFENYMSLFYWELQPEQMRFYVVGQIAAYVLAFMLTYRIHRLIDKRATIVLAAIGLTVFPAAPFLLRIVGMFPENGSDNLLFWIVVFKFLGSGSGAVLNISVMSALADVADENQLISGDRQEGILYSARTFFAKVDHALGLFLAGVVLDYIAFPTDAEPGQVAGSVLFRLGMVDGPFLILPGLIAACLYASYRINERRHAEIMAELRAKT